MAYNSSRNYAQEIQDLIKAGGDPAKVNQLLNERLEKQQSMDTGYSTYDDVYRQAMDYITGSGATPTASANVDYAEIANQILSSQGAEADDMTHRSWSDLGTVLDAREKKLATGKYDEWADSTIVGGDMAYNGENSVHQMLKDYAAYTQMEQDYYQQAADILRGQSGGGYTGGGYYGGGYQTSGALQGGVPVVSTGGAVAGTPGESVVITPGVSVPYYSEEDWAKKQQREAARDAVAVTNAATRVPVMGENSSYVQANTNRAFEEATQALMDADDKEAAEAMVKAQQAYEISGIADPLIPGVNPTRTHINEDVVAQTRPAGGSASGGTTGGPSQGNMPGVSMPDYGAPTQTGNNGGNVASQLTDEEIEALLRDVGIVQTPVFSFAGTEFDNATLGSQRGDTAVQQAASILSGGSSGGGVAAPVVAPQTPTVMTQDMVDAGYQAAMDAARAAGDYGGVNQIANDWNRYKEETGRTNPQNLMTSYTVEGLGRVDTETMDKYMRMGIVEAVIGSDGAPKFVYTGTSGLSQR